MDREAVEKVIQTFFDASYEGDGEKMAATFHKGSEYFGFDENGGLHKMSGEEFLAPIRKYGKPAEYPRVSEILSIDFGRENTAVVRTRIRVFDTMYNDIMTLMYLDGKWGIVAKVASGVPIDEA